MNASSKIKHSPGWSALLIVAALGLGAWSAMVPIAVWGQSALPAPVEVRILPMAEVPGDSFTLGEVAEIDGGRIDGAGIEGVDLVTIRRLAELHMGRSPRPGRELRLNRSLLRSRMARVIDPDTVVLKMPALATVMRSAVTVPGADIASRVLAFAAEKITADMTGSDQNNEIQGDFQQALLGKVPDAVLPTGEVDWRIDLMGGRLTSGGTHTYRVEAYVGGQVAWRKLVRVRHTVFRDVVVAKRSIRRNQIIRAADITLERKRVGGLKRESYLASTASAVGQRAKRPIAKGEWVREKLVDRVADVAEGGPVTLEFHSGSLHMRMPGVALVPGKIGAFIPVRNLRSGKIVYGVVHNGDRVLVN